MKKMILPLIALTTLIASCKKDASNADASAAITASIDGAATSFNTNAKAIRTDVSGAHSIQITGFSGSPTGNQIALAVTSMSDIVAGTYSEATTTTSVAGVSFIQGGTTAYMSSNSTTNPASVTITAISSTSVQGTFKGDVFLMNTSGTNGTKKVISNGTFNVKF